ncbi:MAG: hypothetical protein U0470_14600 [Anaerolineae bacterium]
MSTRRCAGFGSAFVVAATAAVAILRPAASGSAAATLTVRAADVWQDAAVDVAAGEPLEIRYITGTWTINVAGRWFDADGYPGYYPRDIQGACALAPLPDQQNGALIGRIGGGPPFLIGNHKALVADRPGALQMRMNDADACVPDNGGAVEVAVDRGAGPRRRRRRRRGPRRRRRRRRRQARHIPRRRQRGFRRTPDRRPRHPDPPAPRPIRRGPRARLHPARPPPSRRGRRRRARRPRAYRAPAAQGACPGSKRSPAS